MQRKSIKKNLVTLITLLLLSGADLASAHNSVTLPARQWDDEASGIMCFDDGTCVDIGDIGIHP